MYDRMKTVKFIESTNFKGSNLISNVTNTKNSLKMVYFTKGKSTCVYEIKSFKQVTFEEKYNY